MIKNGPLTLAEVGEQAYLAWRWSLIGQGVEVPQWSELNSFTQAAWARAAGEFATHGARYDGWSWREAGRLLYENLRSLRGLIGDAPEYEEAELAEQAAIEAVVRHLVNCHQADEGDNLSDLAELWKRLVMVVREHYLTQPS